MSGTSNIQNELNRINIKFLNIDVNLSNQNKPEIIFKDLNDPYVENIENVELASKGFKYEPFAERNDLKIIDEYIKNNLKGKEIEEKIEKFTAVWNKERNVLILNKPFISPGIYTGILKIQIRYKKEPEYYVVSFKKSSNDYLLCKKLIIDSGILTLEDIYITDGHKFLACDSFDDLLISYGDEDEGSEKKAKEISLKNRIIAIDKKRDDNKNSVKVGLIELINYGNVEAGKKITLKAKYLGNYETSLDILLVEEHFKVNSSSLFVTNQPFVSYASGIEAAFSGVISASAALPSDLKTNTSIKGDIKLGSYSVASFEQTYGSSTSVLGGINLDVKFSGNYSLDVGIKELNSTNPTFSNTNSFFIYTSRLVSYSMKYEMSKKVSLSLEESEENQSNLMQLLNDNPTIDSSGSTGMIGKYFYKVGEKTPKLYFDSTMDYEVKSTTDGKNIYFNQKQKPGFTIKNPQKLPAKFYNDWRIKDLNIKMQLNNQNIKHGFNSIPVNFTVDASEDIKSISNVISSLSSSFVSSVKYITPTNIPSIVKTTIIFSADKIDGYMITPKIEELGSGLKATFHGLKPIFKDKNDINEKLKLKLGNVEFKPSVDTTQREREEDKKENNDVVFNLETLNSIKSENLWELEYDSKIISKGIYKIPKTEFIGLNEFTVKNIITDSKLNINTKFKNLEGNISFGEITKSEVNSFFNIFKKGKKETFVASTSTSINLDQLNKIDFINLEIKEDTSRVKLNETTFKKNKKDQKQKKKYQGNYKAGILIENHDFKLNLSHTIENENTIAVSIVPEFYNKFDSNRISSGRIYYKKYGDNSSPYKSTPIIFDENKNGKALIEDFKYNTRYDVVAAYDYTDKVNSNVIENRVYSEHMWVLLVMA